MSLFSGPPNIEMLQAKGNIRGLLKALQYKKKWQVRATAAEALGELKSQNAIEPLITLLQDNEPQVQIAAIQALGKLGNLQAVQPLLTLLQGNNPDLQNQVVCALGDIGDPRAVEPLIDILEFKRNQPYQSFVVQRTAIQALGKLRDSRACEPLIDLLRIREDRNEFKWVQRTVADVLGEAGDPTAIEPLIELLKDTSTNALTQDYRNLGTIESDNALLKAIVQAIGRLGDGKIVGQILQLIEKKETAETAVAVLYHVLEQRTNEIATENLRAISRLDGVVARRSTTGDGTTFRQEETTMDCSSIKKLAQQELIRRGLQK